MAGKKRRATGERGEDEEEVEEGGKKRLEIREKGENPPAVFPIRRRRPPHWVIYSASPLLHVPIFSRHPTPPLLFIHPPVSAVLSSFLWAAL